MLQLREVIDKDELEAVVEDVTKIEGVILEGQLSLNVMWGIKANQTMLIKGNHGKRRLHILIDAGSTHNFLSEKLVNKI